MKLNMKIKLFLVGTAVTTFGVFAVNGYISKNTEKENSILMPKSSVQLESAVKLSSSLKHINTKQEVSQVASAVASDPKATDNHPLNRGGSGLSQTKPEVNTKAKTDNKPAEKTQTKSENKSSSGVQVKSKTAVVSKTQSGQQTVAVFGTSYKMSLAEKDLFCRLVNAETEGEPYAGKLAVATVIVNRLISSEYPNTITGVIMDRNWGYQFTPVIDGRIDNPASADSKKAVDEVIAGKRSFSSDVLYFVNPKKAASSWIMQNKTYFKTIGNHDFYY